MKLYFQFFYPFLYLVISNNVLALFSPLTMFWSILGLSRPRSDDDCFITDMPANGCSLSYGLEVSVWPPHSNQMFFLHYGTCDAILNKDMFRRRPFVQYNHADPGKYYTITILDRDSFGLDKGEYFLHYLVSNIEDTCSLHLSVQKVTIVIL